MSKFFELVDSAIQLSLENRRLFPPEHFCLTAYLHEFCTVKVSCDRACGKTKYIVERARPWDVVIVANQVMKHEIGKQGCKAKVFTFEEVVGRDFGGLFRGRPQLTPRNIYIDEGSFFKGDFAVPVWQRFACHHEQTPLVLG